MSKRPKPYQTEHNPTEGTPTPESKPKTSPARAAIKAEAAGEETTAVRYQGLEFHVPTEQEDWPTEAVEAFQEGRHIQGTKILLGPEQ